MVREGGAKGESKVFNRQVKKNTMTHHQTYRVYIVSVTFNLSEVEHVMGTKDFNTRQRIVCLNSIIVNKILKFAKHSLFIKRK